MDGAWIASSVGTDLATWNESAEDRVVLFVDFRRPLPFPVSLLNRLFLWMQARSRFVRDGRDNLEAWNRRRDGRPL